MKLQKQQDVRAWFSKRGWMPLVSIGESEHWVKGGERVILFASQYPEKVPAVLSTPFYSKRRSKKIVKNLFPELY